MAPWMINCKEYAKLVSRGLDGPLSFRERVSIKMHDWICPPCNHVKKQLKAIGEACRFVSSNAEDGEDQSTVLPDDACERIKAALKNLPDNKEA